MITVPKTFITVFAAKSIKLHTAREKLLSFLHQLHTYQLISHHVRQRQDQDLFLGNFTVQTSLESGTETTSSLAPFYSVQDPLKPTTFFCQDTVGHHSSIKRQGSSFTYSLETKEGRVDEKDLRNSKNEKNEAIIRGNTCSLEEMHHRKIIH